MLGSGKFSIVYKARQDETNLDVVVKVFQSRDIALRDNENRILSALVANNNSEFRDIGRYVPQVLHTDLTDCGKPVIILDKIGLPLQPIERGNEKL